MKKAFLAAAAVLLCCAIVVGMLLWYHKSTQAMRFARGLGAGINLGNSLDVYNIERWKPGATAEDYQQAWGNPLITPAQLADIRKAGFATVRLPVSWGDHLLQDGSIDPQWLARVAQVVDDALAAGLYVVLNTHHELWLSPAPQDADATLRQLCAIWAQLAQRFAAYDQRLLFEGMNEPRVRGSAKEWDGGTPQERAVVNRLNAAFVETVRAAGGSNAIRYLLLGGYATSYHTVALQALELPQDSYLIVSVHAYPPYSFAQDESGTASWSAQNPKDTSKLEEMFAQLEQLFLRRRIPVVITEFGCTDKDNEAERLAWVDYYTKAAAALGIPYIWWDDGGGYRLLDRHAGGWHFPKLAQQLVKNT